MLLLPPVPTVKTLETESGISFQFWRDASLDQSYFRQYTTKPIMGFPSDLIDQENRILAEFLLGQGHISQVPSFEGLLSVDFHGRPNTMIFSNPMAEYRVTELFKVLPVGESTGETPEVYSLNDYQNDWVWTGNVQTPKSFEHFFGGKISVRYDKPSALLRLVSTCTRLIGNCGAVSYNVGFISPFPNSGHFIRIGREHG